MPLSKACKRAHATVSPDGGSSPILRCTRRCPPHVPRKSAFRDTTALGLVQTGKRGRPGGRSLHLHRLRCRTVAHGVALYVLQSQRSPQTMPQSPASCSGSSPCPSRAPCGRLPLTVLCLNRSIQSAPHLVCRSIEVRRLQPGGIIQPQHRGIDPGVHPAQPRLRVALHEDRAALTRLDQDVDEVVSVIDTSTRSSSPHLG